jgi:hypothetical protein
VARGGARSGKPGANYQNRTDLQSAPRLAPSAPTGQPYGQAGAQLASQAQMPMGPPPNPVPLNAGTSRPNEPIQSGLPIGPGPGPESAMLSSPDPVETTIRALYATFPNRDLAALIEDMDRNSGDF